MKKLVPNILTAVLFLLIQATMGSQSWFYFQGQVVSEDNMLPIANYPVFIESSEEMQIMTMTDNNGFYYDSVYVETEEFDHARVGVFNCEDEFVFAEFDPPQEFNNADFSICYYNQECQAFFSYYFDGQDEMKVHFLDASMGSHSSAFWDFGDGETSNDDNPAHAYSEFGYYEVGLIIEDSVTGCWSEHKDMVYLGDSLGCQAGFTYSENPVNANEIQFADMSMGNIDYWFWDFGDGDTSEEQDPSHVFPQNGIYEVCLFVSSQMMTCSDMYCMEIEISDSATCFADFTYSLDTLNNTPYTYVFTDESSDETENWYWDFGDGSFSEDQNPVHVFDSSGTYQVCLFSSANPLGGDCSGFICKEISTPDYFNFGGHAFIDGFPINIEEDDSSNIATAYLYRRISNQWRYMDKRDFWKFGYYWFVQKPVGEYLLRLDLTPQSIDYQNYAPSYYQHQTDWRYATTFVLENNDQFAVDVNLKKLVDMDAGIGGISGKLVSGLSCDGDLNLSGRIVKLYLEDDYVAYSKTNNLQEFGFSSLPNGLYRLQAEVSGKSSSVGFVQIDDNQLFSDGNLLEINCDAYVGVQENLVGKSLSINKVYPVPADDYINISMISSKRQNIQIELIDALGRNFETYKMNIESGLTSVKLNISKADRGLMLYRVLSGEAKVVARGKFIHGR